MENEFFNYFKFEESYSIILSDDNEDDDDETGIRVKAINIVAMELVSVINFFENKTALIQDCLGTLQICNANQLSGHVEEFTRSATLGIFHENYCKEYSEVSIDEELLEEVKLIDEQEGRDIFSMRSRTEMQF